MSIPQPILTQGKLPKDLWGNGIHTLQNERKYCGNSSYLWSFIHFLNIL